MVKEGKREQRQERDVKKRKEGAVRKKETGWGKGHYFGRRRMRAGLKSCCHQNDKEFKTCSSSTRNGGGVWGETGRERIGRALRKKKKRMRSGVFEPSLWNGTRKMGGWMTGPVLLP